MVRIIAEAKEIENNLKPSVLISLLLLFTACHREEIDVPINADFSYEVIDNDYSIPVKIAFANKSSGAQTYIWTFEGGSPETYTQKDPGYMPSQAMCQMALCGRAVALAVSRSDMNYFVFSKMPVKRKITEPDGVYFITITCHQWLCHHA